MKLISCHIENFGKLHDFSIDFTDKENVICEENGWGKSTFAAFIRAMFYGLEGERKRSLEENERKRYTPWQGGAFGGRITFEVNGKRYIATRFFDEQEDFELRDAETNLISADYSKNLGDELFKINRESFMRTVFIGQNDCVTSTTDDIHAKIGNLADNTNDLNSYEKASENLTKILNSMTPRRSTGSLSRRKGEITEFERKVTAGQELEKSIDNYQEYLQKEQENYETYKKEIKVIGEEQKRVSGLQTVFAQRQQWEELKAAYQMRESEMQKMKSSFGDEVPTEVMVEEVLKIAGTLRNGHEQLIKEKAALEMLQEAETRSEDRKNQVPVLTIVGAVVVVVAIILMVASSFGGGLALAAVGSVLATIGIISLNKAKQEAHAAAMARIREAQTKVDNTEKDLAKLQNHIIRFLQTYRVSIKDENFENHLYELKNRISHYNYTVQLRKEAEKKLKEFEKQVDITVLKMGQPEENLPSLVELNAKILQLNEAMELSQKAIQGYNQNLERLQEQYDEWEANKLHLENLKQMQDEEEKKYRHVELAKRYLGMAKEAMTTKYVGPIMEKFEKYYESIVRHSADRFHMDANTEITVDECGKQRETNALSSGYQDLIGICLRVALVDAMYTGEKPVLIMDDPFVNLDDEKMVAAKAFLEQISENYQIIYFTCSRARR